MLKVKTYLDKSTIKNGGIGLFSDENIIAGRTVWEFKKGFDFTIKEEELIGNDDLLISFVNKYGYWDEGNNYWVICIDNARFMNHSTEANTYEEPNSDEVNGRTISSKPIKKGEEILCNYFEFDGKAKRKLNIF